MSAWAKPGAKCVCVDAADYDPANLFTCGTMDGLREGAVYTIRHAFMDPVWDTVVVRLVEIERPDYSGSGYEPGFDLSRFRPLITRTQEQDLEHFLPLLKTKEMAE